MCLGFRKTRFRTQALLFTKAVLSNYFYHTMLLICNLIGWTDRWTDGWVDIQVNIWIDTHTNTYKHTHTPYPTLPPLDRYHTRGSNPEAVLGAEVQLWSSTRQKCHHPVKQVNQCRAQTYPQHNFHRLGFALSALPFHISIFNILL